MTVVVDRRSAEAPVRNLSKASVKFLATLGPHVKLPTEMSNFPTLGGPPGANVKVSKGSVKVYACLGPYYPPHTRAHTRYRSTVRTRSLVEEIIASIPVQ